MSFSLHFLCSWSGSHMKWGQSFRIRHITTGRYLCLDEEKGLLVVDPERANTKLSAFCFRASKVSINSFTGVLPFNPVCHYPMISSITDHPVVFSNPFFPLVPLSRRRWMWLRSVMLRVWAFQRSSMESPCALSNMCPQACGSHMLP